MKNVLTLIILFLTLSATAQNPPVSFTYVHIDKNIYTPGETIWLKAYMPGTTKRPNETLLVRLADSQKNIILAREFPAYDLRAHGQLVLPDSIPSGSYTVVAYGNCTGADAADVFTQSITIIDNTDGTPKVSIRVAEGTNITPGSKVTLHLGLQRNGRPVADAKGKYSLMVQGKGKALVNGKLKTDAAGQITAIFTYPDIGVYEHLSIQGTFTVDDSPVPFGLVLPSQKKAITVTAIPEGGVALAGTKNVITVQAIDDNTQPVSGVTVTLTEGSTPVITAITDAQGIAGIPYTFKDSLYTINASLPARNFNAQIPISVQKQGLSLLLEAGNKLMIHNTGAARQTRLELWWQGEVLFSKDITMAANGSLPVVLPPSAQNRIISAGLFNPRGQLTNERVFYTGTKDGHTVTADFGTQKISTRQNVTATITVTDTEGNPVQANLSAAVVHRSLLEKGRYKIMTASRYSAIAPANALQQILGFDPAAINSYLGNKKWRGNLPPPAAGPLNTAAGIAGIMARKNKKQVQMRQMTLITPKGPQLIKIADDGSFYIKPEYLLANESEKCYLFFNNEELKAHTVTLTAKDAVEAAPETDTQVYALEYQTAALPGIPGTIQVEEVVIEKRQSGFTHADYQKWVRDYPDYCSDYVCINNNLNCSYHTTGGLPPYLGQEYNLNGRKVIYTHCLTGGTNAPQKIVNLSTITLPEDFPMPEFEDEFDMKYYTTVAWVPNIDSDANGHATVQFTTSNLEGNFIMVLQGLNITNNEAIYGEAGLEVGGR